MSHAPRLALLRLFDPSGRARRAPDPADMGTAFALDEVLERSGPAAYPAGEPPAARPVVPVAPWRLWLGRKLGA